MNNFRNNEQFEIIDNEKQINWKLDTFESWMKLNIENKEALLILNKIDKYIQSDIDLVFDKNDKKYTFISWEKQLSNSKNDSFSIKQLRIIEKILEAYYNKENNFNPEKNKFEIIEKKESVITEWKLTDRWRKFRDEWKEIINWNITSEEIVISNSDNRKWYIPDFLENDLRVLTELWDSNLKQYIYFLNEFTSIDNNKDNFDSKKYYNEK